MKTAIIAGASGLVGTALVNQLIDNSDYAKIHLLVRNPLNISSEKIVEHIVDFENLDQLNIDEPIHHAFCLLGTTIKKAKTKESFRKVDFEYVYNFAKKARELNVNKFLVVSALGANPKSAIFYNRVKGEIENELKALDFMHYFIFRPSLLMGNRKENRAGEKTAIAIYKVINPLFIGKLNKYKGIQAKQVAKGMVHTALYNDLPFEIVESNKIQQL
jgi:uncharacterized protein YbjT (DUF2867 family)